jgi:hypothetical protein
MPCYPAKGEETMEDLKRTYLKLEKVGREEVYRHIKVNPAKEQP